MGGKYLPKSFSEVPFIYYDENLPRGVSLNMTILTGFVGMSVDEEGFIRPQIGWSIHSYDSTDKAKAARKDKSKKKAAPEAKSMRIPNISAKDEGLLFDIAKGSGISIDHLLKENIRTVKFADRDASQIDQDALREAWYQYESFKNESLFRTDDIVRHYGID